MYPVNKSAAIQNVKSQPKNPQQEWQRSTRPSQISDLNSLVAGAGNFSLGGNGFDLTWVPALPELRTQPRVQCCAQDGGSCSCPECSAKANESIAIGNEEATAQTVPAVEPTEESAAGVQPEAAAESPVAEEATAPGLLVEDSATELEAGQMTKTAFLQQLRSEICRTIEPVVSAAGQTAEGCPYLNYWLDLYQTKDAAHIEKTARKYAPDTATAKTAGEYISIISQRALRAAQVWVATGKITGVPQGVPTTLPSESQNSNNKPVQAKAKNGGVKNADDPQAIQKELGDGQPLASGVRSRMESAFSMSFAGVRTHTDSIASKLSNRVNARAFTVGNHVAFGNGEYQPGTLLGDALIAHELAHVVQQNESTIGVQNNESGYNALETDADKTAVSTIALLWGNSITNLKDVSSKAIPRMRSGLRLQRCDDSKSKPGPTPGPAGPCKPTFKTLEAVKTGSVKMTTAWSGNCEMAFGEPTAVGMTFKSEVDVPAGCTGKLEYVQLIDRCLEKKQDGTGVPARPGVAAIPAIYKRRKSGGYVLDNSDPYLGVNKIVTAPGSATLTTDDSPGSDAAGWDYMSITDKFKMWLLWTPNLPAGSPRVALAMVEWNWAGTATKTGAAGCAAAWTLSGTSANGGIGSATATMPTWTKTYPTDVPYEPGRC